MLASLITKSSGAWGLLNTSKQFSFLVWKETKAHEVPLVPHNFTCHHFKIDHVSHELGWNFKEVIIVIAFLLSALRNQFVSFWVDTREMTFNLILLLRYGTENATRGNVITMDAASSNGEVYRFKIPPVISDHVRIDVRESLKITSLI